MDQASGKIRSPWRRAQAASTPMPKAPVMFTTMVPQGNVSPMARATSPDTKNQRSQRAAVKLGARSVIDDDGAIHRRVRLHRPLDASHMLLADFVMSHWQPADRDQFADVWKAELADIPDYETSTLHMASDRKSTRLNSSH